MRDRIKAISTVEELIDRTLYEDWDEIDDDFEKAQIKTLICKRARELRCLSDVKNIFRQIAKMTNSFRYTKDETPWIVETSRGRYVNAGLLAQHMTEDINYFALRREFDEKDDLYIYEPSKGFYEFCNRNAFKSRVSTYIPTELQSNGLFDNVYGLFMSSPNLRVLQPEQLNCDDRYINVQNGLYNVYTGKLEEHSSAVYSTIQINCKYTDEVDAPMFMKYLSDLCSEDDTGETDTSKAQLLMEWMGLALSNIDISVLKKSLWLYSALGNSGKSVYFEIIRMLLGSKNIVNIPIQKLDDRFSGGALFGRRLNIVPDQSTENVMSSSVFKQTTGGDNIGAEIKGKTLFTFRYRGGMMFGCNGLPYISDDSGSHLFDRMTIVPCLHTVPPEEQDFELIKKLETEKDSIFSFAMEALTRFIANNKRFTACSASDDIMKEYRAKSDTLYAYCLEFYDLTFDKKDKVYRKDFDHEYAIWCQSNERICVKKRNMVEKMAKLGVRKVTLHGYDYYVGLERKEFKGAEKEQNAE